MKCVIVAAGMSTRLRPLTDDIPKCLLTLGGKTILARTIETLFNEGIREIAIVVGFQAPKVKLHLREAFPGRRFRIVSNPKFAETNNAYSLLLSRDFFAGEQYREGPEDNLLILDSDIVFHPALLRELLAGREENRIAVQRRANHDTEEIKVSVDANNVVRMIGKQVPPQETYGESIGIEVFGHRAARQLYETLEQRVRSGPGRQEFYESAFQELIDSGTRITAVDVSKYPAMEIDSPADFERAGKSVVPLIDYRAHVPVS